MATEKTAVVRSFFDLPEDPASNFESAEFLAEFSFGRKIDWSTLLESKRVLIVSEAGMGKTFECRKEQEHLWEGGNAAFFVELADLARGTLDDRFSPDELARFESWKDAQTEQAVFFLDSVDELKLTQTSFERAMKSVANSLSGNLGRATIVITTRPIAIDREIVKKHLPVPKQRKLLAPEVEFANIAMRVETSKEEPSVAAWRYVALAPLNEQQMQIMAEEVNVADIGNLFDAIETQNAHDFARRPLDFLDLCGDWKNHGVIRCHRDQIDSSIEIRLRPNTQRKERVSLSPTKAREGSARLALSAMLTRKFTIWHGDDADRSSGDGALDPTKVLSDWTGDELNTLLERALFGFANYGRVRFHHRSAIEFLAAERLRQLIGKGLSNRALRDLLFVESPDGGWIVRPAMRPVAAWLASDVQFVRKEVLSNEPALLLHEGDPASLDLTLRRSALDGYVTLYGKGGWRGQAVPPLQVRRFASAALAADVARLWQTGIENPEVRETLLGLIGSAQMTANADLAYDIAIDRSAETSSRIKSMIALSQIGDHRISALLDEIATLSTSWPQAARHRAIIEFFPGTMSVEQLIGIFEQPGKKENAYLGPIVHLVNVIKSSDVELTDLVYMQQRISAVIRAGLTWDQAQHRIKSNRQDLLPALISLCVRGLKSHDVNDLTLRDIALSRLLARGDYELDDDTKELRTVLDDSSDKTRSAVFWAQDEIAQLYHPKTERSTEARLFHCQHEGGFSPQLERDKDWVLAKLTDPSGKLEERTLALELAIQWTHQSDQAEKWIDSLIAAAANEPTMKARAERFRAKYMEPRVIPAWQRKQVKQTKANQRKRAKGHASWVEFHRTLMNAQGDLFSDNRIDNTVWNFWRAMEKDLDDRSQAGWNRGFVERMLDKSLANRFQKAFAACWRKEVPSLRSERAPDEKNQYRSSWRMGLAGIYAEAEDTAWTANLSLAEARLACRYALLDLNRLPPWLESLALRYPEALDSIIGSELSEELRLANDSHAMLLQYIRRSSSQVAIVFLPRVRTWIKNVLHANGLSSGERRSMEHAADYLISYGSSEDRTLLREAAVTVTAKGRKLEDLNLWLLILARVDADALVNTLESLAEPISPTKESQVVLWIGTLFGHSPSMDPTTLLGRPDLLLRLLKLANHHVRAEEDASREGVRDVGVRENAEYARSGLFNVLMDSKGALAWRMKLMLADDPNVAGYRDRVITIRHEKLAEELDTGILSEREVTQFENNFEVAPRTRKQMATVLNARLEDIADLLREDFSPRELWAENCKERVLRKALASELQRLALDTYAVVQEATTGDEKETDLRLISKAAPVEAVIELKVAENGYTFTDLRNALRDQLVTKYMAPEHRRVGALVISWKGKKTWKDPDTAKRITFDEVIKRLDAEAQSLVDGLGHDAYLTVRGLYLGVPNLTTRSRARKKKKTPGFASRYLTD